MWIWALLPIKLGLVFLVIHSFILGQFEVIESFDPEKSLPESDLIILNTAQTIHASITMESIDLLSELSFVGDDEIQALNDILNGEIENLNQFPRLQILVNGLWTQYTPINVSGIFSHRINMTDDIQYKWNSEFNFDQYTVGFLGERDAHELDILDHYSIYMKTQFGKQFYTIGNYQMLVGYGLLSWRTFGVKSDFGTSNSVMRRGKGIQPFRSGHESWAYRGIGLESPLRNGKIFVGVSHRLLDGAIHDTYIKFSGLGLHISDLQIQNKNNITESIVLGTWLTNYNFGEVGISLGNGHWADKAHNQFSNLSSSIFGNYQYADLKLFSEIAITPQNKTAIIGGGKIKQNNFYYGVILRNIAPNYFAFRDNAFRNWTNKEFGEVGLLQEMRFKLNNFNLNIYSDNFSALGSPLKTYHKRGYETGVSIDQKINSILWVQGKFKIQETESETYSYLDPITESTPVSTFKTTIKWKQSPAHLIQCQIQEKQKQGANKSSLGIQLRSKYNTGYFSMNWVWVTANIAGKEWLYYWDVNVPGEMKSKVFTRPSHFLGTKLSYQVSQGSKIHIRLSSTWNQWDFNISPIFRCAIQINISI